MRAWNTMRRFAMASLAAGTLVLPGCDAARFGADSNSAADYPRKTVTIICPWAPGGGTDAVSRFWADALDKQFGRSFVVVNRTGGSGAVGHSSGARARPDGYTLTMITFELSTMHHMGVAEVTHRDFDCILQVNADPAAVTVRNDAPWKTLDGFLNDVRRSPGQLKMSGTATGGVWDLARAGLLEKAGLPIDALRWVPSTGAGPSLMELLGGHIDAVCCSVPEAGPQVDKGLLRVLAVMAPERLPDFPEIPTARESGIDWVAETWRGLAAPKGVPPAILQTLQEKCLAVARSDQYAQFMKKFGYGITIRDGREFAEFLDAQDSQWKPVIEAAGYAKK